LTAVRSFFVASCVALGILGGAATPAWAQAAPPAAPESQVPSSPANVIFTEVGGPGFFGSIGYERMLTDWWGARAGVGGFFVSFSLAGSGSTRGHVTFPISTSALIGLGASTTAVEVGLSIVPAVPALLYAAGQLGLRYRQPGEGMVLRLAYTPLVALASEDGAGFIAHWGGIALGKRFH